MGVETQQFLLLSATREPLSRILADGLEHEEPGLAFRTFPAAEQALVHERG